MRPTMIKAKRIAEERNPKTGELVQYLTDTTGWEWASVIADMCGSSTNKIRNRLADFGFNSLKVLADGDLSRCPLNCGNEAWFALSDNGRKNPPMKFSRYEMAIIKRDRKKDDERVKRAAELDKQRK